MSFNQKINPTSIHESSIHKKPFKEKISKNSNINQIMSSFDENRPLSIAMTIKESEFEDDERLDTYDNNTLSMLDKNE